MPRCGGGMMLAPWEILPSKRRHRRFAGANFRLYEFRVSKSRSVATAPSQKQYGRFFASI